MKTTPLNQHALQLRALDPSGDAYATAFVDLLLAAARQADASDVHIEPTPAGLDLRFRIDGVLTSLGSFPAGVAAKVITRLKVLAELLTYRGDVPQEGRIRASDAGGDYEVRVSTFPTLHGERVALRLVSARLRFAGLDDLHLPGDVAPQLRQALGETSGAILVVGPAGSGKTTTLYACLQELRERSPTLRSIVTLEDPIESDLPGIAQSQVKDSVGFDLATAIRAVLRQDPEVIMIGEMRDQATAAAALQAALTGQLVLTSFHADSAAAAIRRLLDMGLEPYAVRSGLLAVLFQRLLRTLCDCARPAASESELLGLRVGSARVAVGCNACGGTGYRGRTVLAEWLPLSNESIARLVLADADLSAISQAALAAGLIDRWTRARQAVEAGVTSPLEVRRVLGFGRASDGQ